MACVAALIGSHARRRSLPAFCKAGATQATQIEPLGAQNIRSTILPVVSNPSAGRARWRQHSTFVVQHNKHWDEDLLKLPSVEVLQEVSDWERAAEIGQQPSDSRDSERTVQY
eukprot:6458949-Amphidinium_carterae.1